MGWSRRVRQTLFKQGEHPEGIRPIAVDWGKVESQRHEGRAGVKN